VLPASLQHKSKPVKIIFVGRNSAEKRFHLFEQIALGISKKYPDVKFEVAGITATKYPSVIACMGELDDAQLKLLYESAHIIVLTSSREGFPLVIMEAMAHGVVPVATAVGDIPNHINESNGKLISATEESAIVNVGIETIEHWINHLDALHALSDGALHYAKENFAIEKMQKAYAQLLLN
jgi:glycosyltransferase involved in cell wall biosynthesis